MNQLIARRPSSLLMPPALTTEGMEAAWRFVCYDQSQRVIRRRNRALGLSEDHPHPLEHLVAVAASYDKSGLYGVARLNGWRSDNGLDVFGNRPAHIYVAAPRATPELIVQSVASGVIYDATRNLLGDTPLDIARRRDAPIAIAVKQAMDNLPFAIPLKEQATPEDIVDLRTKRSSSRSRNPANQLRLPGL